MLALISDMLDTDAVRPGGDAADTVRVVDGIDEYDREGVAEVGGGQCALESLHASRVEQGHLSWRQAKVYYIPNRM